MNFNESKLSETYITDDVLKKLLPALPAHMILVGGQALAFWVERFGVDAGGEAHISLDVDFLGRRDDVRTLAELISGNAKYPPERSMTILCGQAVIVQQDAGTFMSIDVIHRIGNMNTEAVARRAVEAELSDVAGTFLVMHPLDVLLSRAENYRGIQNKQTPNGRRQVILAIDVAKRYIESMVAGDEKRVLKAIERVAEIARSPAGAYAREHDVDIYDAIRPDDLRKIVSNENFIEHRLPRLEREISEYIGFASDDLPSPK